MKIKIETERLIMRNMVTEDVTQDYADWLNDPEISKYLSCANVFQTVESCLDYVRSFETKNDSAIVGIFLKENHLHIGNITFSPPIDRYNKVGTIGISIGRKNFWGKGCAKEALSAIVEYGFKHLGLHRIQAGIAENNFNSLMLYLSCGFKIEGLLRESGFVDGKFQNGYILGIINQTY